MKRGAQSLGAPLALAVLLTVSTGRGAEPPARQERGYVAPATWLLGPLGIGAGIAGGVRVVGRLSVQLDIGSSQLSGGAGGGAVSNSAGLGVSYLVDRKVPLVLRAGLRYRSLSAKESGKFLFEDVRDSYLQQDGGIDFGIGYRGPLTSDLFLGIDLTMYAPLAKFVSETETRRTASNALIAKRSGGGENVRGKGGELRVVQVSLGFLF